MFVSHKVNVAVIATNDFIAARTSEHPAIILSGIIMSSFLLVGILIAVILSISSMEHTRAEAIVSFERAK